MTAAVGALPRADLPRDGAIPAGFFRFGSTSLRGLPLGFWALCLYLLLGVSAAAEEWPALGRFRPRLLLGLLAVGFGAVGALRERAATGRPTGLRSAVGWAWLAMVLAGTLSTIWAFDPALAREEWIAQVVSMLSLPAVLLLVRTRRELLVLVLVLCLGYGFYLLRSFQEFLNGKILSTMGVNRMLGAGSTYADPNSFAATIAFSMPLLLWAALHARSVLLRFCVLAYGLLGAYCVVQTHSRSGLVLAVLVVLWTLLVLPRGRARLALLAALVVLGAVAAARLTENAVTRYASILSSETYREEESTHGRITGYVIAWRIFEDHPAFGIGPGCWGAYRERRVDGTSLLPHNLAGQLLATTGLAGALSFLAFVAASVAAIVRTASARRRSPEPWDRAVRSLAGAMGFTLFLLFVSGLAAHNVGREAWTLAPALVLAAAAVRGEPILPGGNA